MTLCTANSPKATNTASHAVRKPITPASDPISQRTTPPSQEELNRRNAFKQAAIATRARLMDPDQSLTDQIAFTQQTKYKTIYAYVFNQCYKAE